MLEKIDLLGGLPGKSFLLVQVACDLYLSTVTANLVDKGIIGKNLPYIWQTGGKMLLVSALGLPAGGFWQHLLCLPPGHAGRPAA
ncbi:hypothetical protein ACXO54_07000 [Lactobacillus delbrueckii subsp. bulgaricus]|uniref:hypothetical protein n=1 Tax=Lactobacillus delbrueckii TaxID=1584 RepID=UPI0030E8E310